MNLQNLGWNDFFNSNFETHRCNGYSAGRVVSEHKNMYRVKTPIREMLAKVSGKMIHLASGRADYPAVGDWVAITEDSQEGISTIHAVLPRKSKFSRKAAGNISTEQIVAANIDIIFLVNALNKDFNTRRIERYLTLVWEGGASPVIVLSKADLCSTVELKRAQLDAVAPGVPVHIISCYTKSGLDELDKYLKPGRTIALLGSSGAGKSTLINCLAGQDIQLVQEIREGDDRGRHTTTCRELIMLPGGSLIIDTPGMRELQLWNADEGIHSVFEDIDQLARLCRFNNCSHTKEPGCAVQQAISQGNLPRERYDSFLKLQKELEYLSRKQNVHEQLAYKNKWKKIYKEIKNHTKK